MHRAGIGALTTTTGAGPASGLAVDRDQLARLI
jgi:hypothetical protein